MATGYNHADPAHDRGRDRLGKGGEFADEGQEKGDDRRAADDQDRVDPGDCHDTNIFAIGGGRHRTAAAG